MTTHLKAEQLRKTYDPNTLPLPTPGEQLPVKAIIGQKRAVTALQFGLGNKARGFNIYVAGIPGTGKQTAVMHYLEELSRQEPAPCDWVYVNHFQDPYYPKKLSLPKGEAHKFRNALRHFLVQAHSSLIKIFESEDFTSKRDELIQKMQDEESNVYAEVSQKAKAQDLIIQRTPVELITLPMVNDRPMNDKEFAALSQEEKEAIFEKQRQFKDELRLAARKTRDIEIHYSNLLRKLEQDVARRTLDTLLEELKTEHAGREQVLSFLEDLKNDILEHLKDFVQFNSDGKSDNRSQQPLMKENSAPRRYEVNVLVDNRRVEGAPILLEINPTYNNLFGKIEKESSMGAFVTDFTLIRSGSLHKANGGYLIIPVEELLRNFNAWDSLKRALSTKAIDIEEPGERLGFLTTKSLKPEPIPLNIQVILIGRPMYYYLLLHYDEDFRELFKVKADFDLSMEKNDENTLDFIRFIQHFCREEDLLPLDAAGMAKLLEHTHRLANDQEKISTRFGEITDLIREAQHYAGQEQASHIGEAHISKTIDQQLYRSGLLREKIQEGIERGEIMLDLEGSKTGQVNGLFYIDQGDIAFAHPSRITANVSVGQAGIVDIEREVQLGGPIHSKGVMIFSGYLAEKFGQDKLISLSAQLTFEQSYSEIEGDSASSAELYALLSSLSGIPIRQGIAVSGSVNQKGEVQAVGGINEKIEGFFDICRIKGLTGEQGVLIPANNQKHLMLKEEVVEAAHSGQFHIWAVNNIAEGIEILTGVPAGEPTDATTFFAAESVFEQVDKRLSEISDILKGERTTYAFRSRKHPGRPQLMRMRRGRME